MNTNKYVFISKKFSYILIDFIINSNWYWTSSGKHDSKKKQNNFLDLRNRKR